MEIKEFSKVREILGEPNPATKNKIYSFLNPRMINFINHSPLVFISTIDSDGFPTISPKGDFPGFVNIQNQNTLLLPERKGNKLAFSYENILNGSKVGILFLVPGTNEVLRVQGSSEVIFDEQLNALLSSQTQKALLIMKIKVSSCYFHCGKALLRSKLWESDKYLETLKISFGQEIAENNGMSSAEIFEFDSGVKSRYETDL